MYAEERSTMRKNSLMNCFLWVGIAFWATIGCTQEPSGIQAKYREKWIHPGIDFPGLPMVESGYMGWAVDIEGDTAVVSTPFGPLATGMVQVFQFENEMWIWKATLRASDESPMNCFGSSVSIEGDTIAVGANNSHTEKGDQAGAVYLFEKPADGWRDITETVKLVADQVQAMDVFGYSIDLENDTLVVGAPYTDIGGIENIGCVYVYTKPATGWSTNASYAVLIPNEPTESMSFGEDVAIHRDTIAVGAPQANGMQGCVCLYEKPASGWVSMAETAVLKVQIQSESETDKRIYFGRSVALSDDTLVVGTNTVGKCAYVFAKPENGWGNAAGPVRLSSSLEGIRIGWRVNISGDTIAVSDDNNGGVHVFEKPVGGWKDSVETARIEMPPMQGWPDFGWDSAISGNRILIGARYDNSAGFQAGSAFVYEKQGTHWGENDVYTQFINGNHRGDLFGRTLAMDGNTAVVGTPQCDEAMVYVYENDRWNYAGTLTPGPLKYPAQFGQSVGISGDTIVVGAPYAPMENGSSQDSGMAYVFVKPAPGWTSMKPTAQLYCSTMDISQEFAGAVAISGDTIVIGSPLNNGVGMYSGNVYVYEKPETGWASMGETATLQPEGLSESFRYGYSVSIDGNIIAAGCGNNPQVYVFEKKDGGWESRAETAILSVPELLRESIRSYGTSILVSGNSIAVAAPMQTNEDVNSGAIYIYHRPDTGWVNTEREDTMLLPPINLPLLQFGYSLAMDGDYLLVGTPTHTKTLIYTGAAFLYERRDDRWVLIQELHAENPIKNAQYGTALALKNGRLLIGMPRDNPGGENSGSVLVYDLKDTLSAIDGYWQY